MIIVVDTAPVSLYGLVAKHADCFIYVARASILKRMLGIANLYEEGSFAYMCMLYNRRSYQYTVMVMGMVTVTVKP
jgi:hypothetical protein